MLERIIFRTTRYFGVVAIIAAATASTTTTTSGFGHRNLLLKDCSFFTCLGKRNYSAMEGVAFASFTSFATKSLLFSSLSPSSIITHRQKSQKNTLKTISPRNLVIRASSASSSGSVVTLLDYGAGNVRSLRNAIRYLGFEIEDVRTPKDILNADRLIFPGVGAFASAMDVLVKTGTNDKGDLVVTKGDQYDVREQTKENEVRNLGKPVELSGQYYKDGADEVSFLNITGFRDFPLGDLPMLQVLRHASQNVFVPLTVGGGIRDFTDSNGRYYSSLEVASEYFRSGADKISIGSDAVYAAEEYLKTKVGSFTSLGLVKTGKSSLEQISRVYGNQAVVVSIDPRRVYVKSPNDVKLKTIQVTKPGPNGEVYAWYQCTVNGGREGRPIGAYELAKAVEELGAGEILLNCIDCDGQGKGFDIDLINLISDAVSVPVIASSGAGAVKHFSEVFTKTNASAALAAGIFHRKEVPIQSVKGHLLKEGIEVRI
ncbi:hypothetical protein F383_29249 [Gossypium arboreum]|uniref:Uncharacterized protein n=1 Tax=Gossypium arboreum TaxID=29729 RepID=A0A0B0MR62_GOSAR|nr:hypothetical protein F383_29249 [Gossypium arboreum]